MRIAPALSTSQFRRRHLLGFGTLLLGAFAAYQLAQYVIYDDMVGLVYAALCVAGAAVVVLVLNNWRNGVYLFLSWLLFEDLVRKFLGNNMTIYFAKDFLLLTVFISFFSAVRRKEVQIFKPPFRVPLLVLIWFGALQIFNPASTSIWYGLMGFKVFFYYVPLVLIGYSLLSSEAELRRFFMVNVALIVIVVSLGIVQSIVGPSFLNPAVPAEDIREVSTLYRSAPLTGEVAYRPAAVFVSAGRYGDFIMISWLIVLGFSGYLLLRHKRGRLLAFIALPIAAAGAFLTASRGPLMWSLMNAAITSLAFVWGAPWKQGEARRVFRSIQRVALGIAVGIAVLFYAYPNALLSRLAIYQQTLLPHSGTSDLAFRGWTYPMNNFLGAFDYARWPYGYGLGTTSNGGQYVARFFHVQPPVIGVESGFGTLVVEMGIVGLILWCVMSSAILFSAYRVVRRLKGSPWFPLAFVIFWYAFLLLGPATFAGIAAYADFLLNAYLWLLLGLLFRLPTIALSAQFATAAPGSPPAQRWIR